MIDQFSISSGGGQCPPLRGIDRLPSAAKTVSPAMTNKPDRATILIRMLYHGYPGFQHSISDFRNGLWARCRWPPTRETVAPLKQPAPRRSLFARIRCNSCTLFTFLCAEAQWHGLQRALADRHSSPLTDIDRH